LEILGEMGGDFFRIVKSVFGLIWGLCPLSVDKTHLLMGGYGGRKGGKMGRRNKERCRYPASFTMFKIIHDQKYISHFLELRIVQNN
jgi:hypothetical protein